MDNLGVDHCAADIVYADMPPAPISWAHQLKESSWAGDVHYHYSDNLVKELHRTIKRLMST